MKNAIKLFLLVLGFFAGIVSGAFIRLGFEILGNRPVSVGGEALILPLIVLLFCFGFAMGRMVQAGAEESLSFADGYQYGYRKGRVAERTAKAHTAYLDAEWRPSTHSTPGR